MIVKKKRIVVYRVELGLERVPEMPSKIVPSKPIRTTSRKDASDDVMALSVSFVGTSVR
jgi:hypothetical protein